MNIWKNKEKCLYLGIGLGIFFSLIFSLGKSIQEEWWIYEHGWKIVVKYGITFLCVGMISIPLFSLLYFLYACIAEGAERSKENRKTEFLKKYMLMLLLYIGCFLAYFPGCMSYDSWYITLQALGKIRFDNHHPFLHTLIWSIFAHMDKLLGINQIGIILYTVVQLLVMVAIYTYVSIWIGKRLKGTVWGERITFCYYAFNPIFHIFTILLTKDVYFSGCFLLFTISLIDNLENELNEKDYKIGQRKMVFLALLSCLFRNNMIYVIIIFTIILFFVSGRRIARCKGFLLAIGLFYFISSIVYPSMGVAKGSVKEMLSVPMSQIAAVYINDTGNMRGFDKDLTKKYIPDVESYDRFFADPIKANFNAYAFEENKEEFLLLWWNLFFNNPIEFARAFLALNLPYWYPPMDSVREYIETDNYSEDYPVERLNLLPKVYDFYERVSENKEAWMHWPVFRLFYSVGVPIWLFLFFLLWFVVKRKKVVILTILPSILLWMTYLLGPVSSFRYAEPLLLTYPVWLVLGVER